MKQTSIDWLVNELEEHHVFYDIKNTNVFQIAKEMHKEEIIKAWKMGDGKYDVTANKMSLEYYNETYKKD